MKTDNKHYFNMKKQNKLIRIMLVDRKYAMGDILVIRFLKTFKSGYILKLKSGRYELRFYFRSKIHPILRRV